MKHDSAISTSGRAGLTDGPYWERFWAQSSARLTPSRGPIADFVREQSLEILSTHVPPGQRWIEIGCANSRFLYDFPIRLGSRLDGVDIVESALTSTGAELGRHGIDANLRLHDFRSPTAEEVNTYDGAISWGFVEHFAECVSVHQDLMRYVKPGGLVISVVPNLTGLPGLLQQWLDMSTFLHHNVLTAETLRESAEAAGLEVISSEPVISLNLAVVNPASRAPAFRRSVQGLFAGVSRAHAVVDNVRRRRPTRRHWSAPYLMLVARVPLSGNTFPTST